MADVLNVSLFLSIHGIDRRFDTPRIISRGLLGSSSDDKALSPGAMADVSWFLVRTAGALLIGGIGTAGAATVELDTLTRSGDTVALTRAVAGTVAVVT